MFNKQKEFDKLFGPFSFWALLPFKRIDDFWDKIQIEFQEIIYDFLNTFTISKENIIIFNYMEKYVQKFYPV